MFLTLLFTVIVLHFVIQCFCLSISSINMHGMPIRSMTIVSKVIMTDCAHIYVNSILKIQANEIIVDKTLIKIR